MKKIRIEQGRLAAYIEQSDVETLIRIKDVVPATFFDEETIKRGFPDEEGYYRIDNLCDVNYIKTATFIPNEDYLNKLSNLELEKMLKKAISDKHNLGKILRKLYGRNHLSQEEKEILESSDALKTSLTDEVQKKAFAKNDVYQETRFIVLEEALQVQSEHYAGSIERYLAKRKAMKENKEGGVSKKFSLKRLFNSKKQ
ncbi:MAG: hypothetical protein ACI4ON_05270 [Clostridia bacterium]